jgi:hypothetical protein
MRQCEPQVEGGIASRHSVLVGFRDVRLLLQLVLADPQAGHQRQAPVNRRDDGWIGRARLVVR